MKITATVSSNLKVASRTTKTQMKRTSKSYLCLSFSLNALQAAGLRFRRITLRSIWSCARTRSSRCTMRATYSTVWALPRLHLRNYQEYSTPRLPISFSRINSWRLILIIRSTMLLSKLPLYTKQTALEKTVRPMSQYQIPSRLPLRWQSRWTPTLCSMRDIRH